MLQNAFRVVVSHQDNWNAVDDGDVVAFDDEVVDGWAFSCLGRGDGRRIYPGAFHLDWVVRSDGKATDLAEVGEPILGFEFNNTDNFGSSTILSSNGITLFQILH